MSIYSTLHDIDIRRIHQWMQVSISHSTQFVPFSVEHSPIVRSFLSSSLDAWDSIHPWHPEKTSINTSNNTPYTTFIDNWCDANVLQCRIQFRILTTIALFSVNFIDNCFVHFIGQALQSVKHVNTTWVMAITYFFWNTDLWLLRDQPTWWHCFSHLMWCSHMSSQLSFLCRTDNSISPTHDNLLHLHTTVCALRPVTTFRNLSSQLASLLMVRLQTYYVYWWL